MRIVVFATLLLAALALTGVVNLPLWAILMPVWIVPAFIICLAVGLMVAAAIVLGFVWVLDKLGV